MHGPEPRSYWFPTTAAVSRALLLALFERLSRDAGCVHSGRHTGVYSCLQQYLSNFLSRDPVAQRALHVDRELMRPIESGEHGKIHHAADTPREPLAGPDCAP